MWSKVVLQKLDIQWGSVQGIFLLQNPLGFPAWLYHPITVSDILGKKKVSSSSKQASFNDLCSCLCLLSAQLLD